MSATIEVKISDQATPILAELQRKLEDRTELNRSIAAVSEVLTRRHIAEVAAPLRHTTAKRLGAKPTGYLNRRANAIESSGTREEAIIRLGGAPEIFARVDGPVIIRAKEKLLTIPATAEAYGRRAGEFSDLRFVMFPSGAKALIRAPGHKRGPERVRPVPKIRAGRGSSEKRRQGPHPEVVFWLRDEVELPQDRGLLPSEDQYTQAAELGARDYLKTL